MPGRSRALARPIALSLALAGLLCAPPVTAAPPADGEGSRDTPPSVRAGPVWTPGLRDPAAGYPGRWVRELEARRALLAAEKGSNPRAIVGLLGLLPELQGEIPNDELDRFLAGVGADRSRHPLVAVYARYLQARLREARGDFAGARDDFRELGWIVDWQILGPFDNASGKGHAEVLPPETTPFDPSQAFTGLLPLEPLTWRALDPSATARAYISFDELLRPNTYGTGFATTWIRVPRKGDYGLHLGTSGAYRVWVDGLEVGEGDAYRSAHPLQETHGVRLDPGWHRLTIKVGVEESTWGFYLRVSDAKGLAVPGLEVQSTPPPDWRPAPAPGADDEASSKADKPRAPARIASLRGELEARAAPETAKAEDLVALVELYRWTRPFADQDMSDVDMARRADARAKTARSAWLLAVLDPDQNDSRAALVDGIARAREEGPPSRALLGTMLVELAWRYRTLGLERRARELLEEAFRISPDDALVELSLVDHLAEDGLRRSAAAWVDDLVARYPESVLLRRERASRLIDLGHTREGLEILEQLSAEQHADGTLVSERIDAHLRLGEAEAAVSLGRRIVDASPGLPRGYRRLAGLFDARGDVEAAVGALEEAVALSPQDADLHAQLGRMRTRAGDREGGIKALQRSLELKPQQPEVRDLLSLLDPRGADDLFARHARALEAVVGEAGEVPAQWAGKEARVLHQMVAVRVLPNGLQERLDHRIVEILDDRGARSQAIQGFSYDPQESYVDVRRARVRRADGTIEDIGSTRTVSLAEAGYRMYYDQRQVQVVFSGLRVGDVLEVAFVRRDVAARNMFDEYFGDLVPLQGSEPRDHVEYVLEAPKDKRLYFNRKLDTQVDAESGIATYRLEVDQVPGLKPEANMPGWTEVADYLHVSTFKTWSDVGRWYWGLVEEQLVVDDKIRAGVQKAVASLPVGASEEDRIAAVYRHVIRETRYVGLEFGIHGYKPYRTTDIYDRRFGDCKDKASLLKVMLAEIGVEAHLVLVRTRDQGRIGKEPASLSAFNHAIVYVPKYDWYMDGTAEYSGATEVPIGDQGASVLVVQDGKGATFGQIPLSTPADNVQQIEQDVRLAADGSAAVEHRMTLRGAGASSWRARFESEDERLDRFTEVVASDYPGTEVDKVVLPGIEDVLRPVEVEARLDVPHWGHPSSGGGLRFPVRGRDSTLVRRLAPQIRREHDLVLTAPSREDHTIRYRPPRGARFVQVPESRTVDAPHGHFELQVSESSGVTTVRTVLELRSSRVSPEEYTAFRDFLRDVDAALSQTFEIGPEK